MISKEEDRVLRKEREIAKARKALEKYSSDSCYTWLYDFVCDVFVNFFKADMKKLNSEDLSQISLAAKCCPSIDSSYDKTTLICEGVARRRVRDRLRKQVPYVLLFNCRRFTCVQKIGVLCLTIGLLLLQ